MPASPKTSFLKRYLDGEREAVWAEMTALGAEIRETAYAKDARAVAQETMRRARRNVETLIRRLDRLGYRFEVPKPPSPERRDTRTIEERMAAVRLERPKFTESQFAQVEQMMRATEARRLADEARKAEEDARREGMADHTLDKTVLDRVPTRVVRQIGRMEANGVYLPLSLRAWIEEVGQVCLIGSHPSLSFFEGDGFPDVYADPFMLLVDPFELEEWFANVGGAGDASSLEAVLAWTPQAKARLTVIDNQLDYGAQMTLPNPAADAPFTGASGGGGLVDHLRCVFRWGGFPGWANHPDPPPAIAQLAEKLEPL